MLLQHDSVVWWCEQVGDTRTLKLWVPEMGWCFNLILSCGDVYKVGVVRTLKLWVPGLGWVAT